MKWAPSLSRWEPPRSAAGLVRHPFMQRLYMTGGLLAISCVAQDISCVATQETTAHCPRGNLKWSHVGPNGAKVSPKSPQVFVLAVPREPKMLMMS